MASNLLKAFEKIEEGRRNMIENVRKGLGINISDNASFTELSQYIGTFHQDFSNIIPERPESYGWKRPEEWPDCHSIIRNAEPVDGYRPCYIVLLNTDSDTTLFPKPTTDYYGNNTEEPVNYANVCRRLVLSDGTVYDNITTEITHTWDKSKDVVILEGEFKGTYRWFMSYETNTQPKYFTFAGMPVAEILIHWVPTNGFTNSHWISGSTTETASSTLVNFEVLPEFNKNSIGMTGSLGMWQYTFVNCRKLKHFSLGPVTSVNPSSTNGSAITGWTSMVELDSPKCNNTKLVTASLESHNIEVIRTCISGSISVGPKPLLRLIDAPDATVTLSMSASVPGYIPEDCELNVKGFYYNPPIYWTSNKGYLTGTYYSDYIIKNHYNIRTLDLSVCSCTKGLITTDNTVYALIGGCNNLRELITHTNWKSRMDLSDCRLNHSSVLELLYNLADLNKMTAAYYNPIIKLSEYNKSQLTEAEVKIATDKGWEIQ